MSMGTADRDLYWTSDDPKTREIVEETDPRQRYLCIHRGAEVTELFLKESGLGFDGGKLVIPGSEKPKKEVKKK